MKIFQDLIKLASDLVDGTRPLVEWLFFVSGIGLFFVALYGLKQIKLLKIDMLSRSERSAKEKAIEACEKFLNEGVVGIIQYAKELVAKNLSYYDGPVGNFKTEEFVKGEALKIEAWPQKIQDRYLQMEHWVVPFNRIEAIAATFVTGVADEQVGFEVIGLDFVDFVKENYDIYTMAQRMLGPDKQNFSNSIKLYKTWSPRFTQKELEQEKKSVEDRLKRLDRPSIPNLKPKF
jgi:hypothetical protein